MTLLAAMLARGALAGAPLPPVPAPQATVAVFDNGVRVAILEDRRAPLVATWVRVSAGSADEAPAGTGVAHLLEHLLFTGSPLAPDGGYDRLLADAGADNNAWTDHDATALFSLAPAGAWRRVLALEADRLAALPAALDDDDLSVQRAVVEAEADLEERAPHGRDLQATLTAVFGAAHPYGVPVMGRPAQRAALDRAAALAFHARAYGGRHVTVALVGDLDPEDALAAARRHLGRLPPGPPRARPTAPPPAPPARARLREAPADRPTVTLAFPTVPEDHPDALALEVLAELVAGAPGRPLDAALAPLALDVVRAWPWGGARGGLLALEVGGAVELDVLVDALEAAAPAALDAAAADPVALDRARRAALLRHLRRAEDPLVQAEALADCVARTAGVACAARRLDRLRALTVDDLQRARATWLAPHRAVVVALAPEGSAPASLPGARPLELP